MSSADDKRRIAVGPETNPSAVVRPSAENDCCEPKRSFATKIAVWSAYQSPGASRARYVSFHSNQPICSHLSALLKRIFCWLSFGPIATMSSASRSPIVVAVSSVTSLRGSFSDNTPSLSGVVPTGLKPNHEKRSHFPLR